MRILCQCDGYLPDAIGGVEVLSAHLHDHLRLRGHEVLVVTSCIGGQPAGPCDYNQTHLHKLEFGEALQTSKMEGIVRLQNQVNDLVTGFRPDVIHLNDARPSSFFFLRRGALRDLPRVLTLHSPVKPHDKGGLQNRLAQEADIVIAVSQSVAEDAVREIPAIRQKLIVISNALPLPKLTPSPIEVTAPTFLCIGRVVEDKAMDVAVEALAILRDRGVKADLVIAGNGPEKKHLERLTEERGLRAHVQFPGWLMPSEIPGAINKATAVLVPSRWKEPFGLVALQAAQMGRPVIASDVGGLPEIVVHGETGFVIPPDDPTALADAMMNLVRVPGLAARMGGNAHERAEHAFGFAQLVTAYEQVFESVRRKQGALVP